jgi:hypothetical protein
MNESILHYKTVSRSLSRFVFVKIVDLYSLISAIKRLRSCRS